MNLHIILKKIRHLFKKIQGFFHEDESDFIFITKLMMPLVILFMVINEWKTVEFLVQVFLFNLLAVSVGKVVTGREDASDPACQKRMMKKWISQANPHDLAEISESVAERASEFDRLVEVQKRLDKKS